MTSIKRLGYKEIMNWTFDRSKLTTLREMKRISTRDLAKVIGKTEESVRLKARGDSPLTVDELAAIASAFQVQPGAFFVYADERLR